MKKKFLNVGIALTSIFLVACGSNQTKEINNNIIENHYIVDGKELTEEEYKKYLNEKETTVNQEQKQEESTVKDTEKTIQEDTKEDTGNILDIYEGNTFTLSDGTNELEITLNSIDFEQEVHSLSDNPFSSYFTDEEGETYIVMKLNIKNIGGNTISEKVFDGYNSDIKEYGKILLTFENKYNYQMQQLDTENPALSPFWNIEPLKSKVIYFFQSVPDEIIEKSYVITFSLVNDDIICRYIKE
ncbi:hypothetical protein [Thomasclavelia cocleata]|uniref:hypothetical protein n=1 Tax=Thomasclavelia cocleata TaxID=69824 RepID=UPI002558155B|nr:hypothetical protein [Thomasclavelia cocleata]